MEWQKIESKWHEIARRLQTADQVSQPKKQTKGEKVTAPELSLASKIGDNDSTALRAIV